MAIVTPLDRDFEAFDPRAKEYDKRLIDYLNALRAKVAELDAGGGAVAMLEARTRAIAAAALSATEDTLVGGLLPFYMEGIVGHQSAPAGTGAIVKAVQGITLTTGGTGGSNVYVTASTITGTGARLLPAGAAKKIWTGAVITKASANAIAAGDGFGILLGDDTIGFVGFVGGHGATSTANFAAGMFNGGFTGINSTVPFDTTPRFWEFYRDGATGNLRSTLASTFYAGGAAGAVVQGNVRPGVDTTFGAVALNDGSAVNTSFKIDFAAAWAVRE
jgi:hypothetical protein